MLLLASLLACAGEITLDPGLGGCTDFDYDNPAASALTQTWTGDDSVVVQRTNVLQADSNLLFDPEIGSDGDILNVYERWVVDGDAGDALAFCYVPEVAVTGAEGKQVRWFLAVGDTIPFATLDLQAP